MAKERNRSGAAAADYPSALRRLVETLYPVTVGGRKRLVDPEEALELRTLNDAFAGKLPAAREVLKWIEARETAGPTRLATLPKILFDNCHPVPLDDAATLLGIASIDPTRLRDDGSRFVQLEPWTVHAALGRKESWTFDKRALLDIKLKVRDPASIPWPSEPGSE